jgi:hypothetical protein
MAGEISGDQADTFDDARAPVLSRGADIQGKFPAPTTHRRVGRSTLKPPGPAVDDGPSEQAVSTEETPEDLGSAIIESARKYLKTRRGRDQLQTALDGQDPDDRTQVEVDRLDRTVAQLDAEHILGARVFVVPTGQMVTLHLGRDVQMQVRLSAPERSAWIAAKHGHVIVVAQTLVQDEVVEEALQTIAGEIEGAAVENDVVIQRGGTLRFLRTLAIRFFQDHPETRWG